MVSSYPMYYTTNVLDSLVEVAGERKVTQLFAGTRFLQAGGCY
jgi:hypothetical protein